MSRVDTDYSNTIFYKIYCKDDSCKELYIGHTTNFVQRKHTHKNSSTNIKSINYNLKLYDTIRKHGGWTNWNMAIIAFKECKNQYDARKTEQEYYESFGATLNSIQPLPSKPKHNIDIINNKLRNTSCIESNISNITDDISSNHIMESSKHTCDYCKFKCSRLFDYKRHLKTIKHQKLSGNNEVKCNKTFDCVCGKQYKYRQGLHYHKQKCILPVPSINNSTTKNPIDSFDTLLLTEIFNQNIEFKKLIELQNNILHQSQQNTYILQKQILEHLHS